MKKLFIFLSVIFLFTSLGFAQEEEKTFAEDNLLKNLIMQVEKQQEQANISLEDSVLRAVENADTDFLDDLKYNEEVASFLPSLYDEEENNVFHLAKDENVVQIIAFILRNAENKTGSTEVIKELLGQTNLKGQTPVFKALVDGKVNVYKMYSMFLDLPRTMKKAVSSTENERLDLRNKIQTHLQGANGMTLLDAGKSALEYEENKETRKPERIYALKEEIKALELYANELF